LETITAYESLNASGKSVGKQEDTFIVVRSSQKAGFVRFRSVSYPTFFLCRNSGSSDVNNVAPNSYFLAVVSNTSTQFEDDSSFTVRKNFGGLAMNLKETMNGIQF
jgi:hypothetical protein